MIVDNYNFDIYLEGYLIPGVIHFTISEANNGIPQATINIAGNNKALKILAGTVVQIFGSRINQSYSEPVLLYEGEVNSISYAYNAQHGDTVSLRTHSLLSQFYSTRLRPTDSIVNYQEEASTSLPNSYMLLRNSNIKKASPKVKNSKNDNNEYTTVSFKATSGLKAILTSQALNFSQVMGKGTAG